MGSQGLKGVESRRHIGPLTQWIWEDTSSGRDSPVGQELDQMSEMTSGYMDHF